MSSGSALLITVAGLMASPILCLAQSDTTPPMLTALAFSVDNVDVSTGPQTVTVSATITDDLSGVSKSILSSVRLTSPSGQVALAAFILQSGTNLNGTYQASVSVPEFAESGNWLVSVILRDNAGNQIMLQSATLIADRFPGTFSVVDSNPDTTPPTLIGASITPANIDTSAGPQTVTVTLQITDSQSGVSFSNFGVSPVNAFLMRSGGNSSLLLWNTNFRLVSGTPQDGRWQATLEMPQYSGGTWSFSQLILYDNDSNKITLTPTQLTGMGINPVLIDASTPADVLAPTLTAFSFAPTVIDTSASGQSVTFNVSATEDIAGVYFGLFNSTYFTLDLSFHSPSGNQSVFVFQNFNNPIPIAGTPLAGTWQLTGQWPQFSEQGTWTLSSLTLQDRVGNDRFYTPAQLQGMGLPTSIVVTKPSLASDGTIGPAGGTVTDNAFGARASITFPPGLVQAATDVSIDVFPSPLSVPTPGGFTMPGTYFENLAFSPAFSEPIPAPGITVVLPLLTPMTPGARLSLYHIDPLIGLAPAMNAAGNPVVGTVNPDGVDATFDNVVTLSTVVAYLSNGSVLGDVNGDGMVNCTDVSIVKSGFGKHTGQPGYNIAADLNNDGTVNLLDLFIVSRQLGGTVCK